MYNYDVKALSKIFETYFLPLQMLIITINANNGRNSKQFNDVQKWNQIPSETMFFIV